MATDDGKSDEDPLAVEVRKIANSWIRLHTLVWETDLDPAIKLKFQESLSLIGYAISKVSHVEK